MDAEDDGHEGLDGKSPIVWECGVREIMSIPHCRKASRWVTIRATITTLDCGGGMELAKTCRRRFEATYGVQ